MSHSAKNIIDFWNSIEKFTPSQIEIDNNKKPFTVKSIQREVFGKDDLPWLNKKRFNHTNLPNKVWVYTIFIGMMSLNSITKITTKLLNTAEEHLDSQKGFAPIACFNVNLYGKIIENSLVIPDYFLSLSSLVLKEKYPDSWIDKQRKIKIQLNHVFNNMYDELQGGEVSKTVEFEHIEHLLTSFLDLTELAQFMDDDTVTNNAVIYSKQLDIYKDKDGIEKIKDDSPDIMNSFFIEDLSKISDLMRDEKNEFGLSLEQYISRNSNDKKIDFFHDESANQKFSQINFWPPVRWPGKGDFPLALSQQIAVNLALNSEEGLFSVNGPPGTGKTTLLRDIISGVVYKRAKLLSLLDHPNDAFVDPTTFKIDQYTYKVWKLKPELLGHEIFITSSNNNAVENISKEFPKGSEVDEKWSFDYFSDIGTFLLEEESWGLGSATLGNSTNRYHFFNKFWSKKPNDGSKYGNDQAYGLEHFLNNNLSPVDWDEAKEKFLSLQKEYNAIIKDLSRLESALKDYSAYKKDRKKYEKDIALFEDSLKDAQNEYQDELKRSSQLENLYEIQNKRISEHQKSRFTMIEIIFDAFNGFKNYHAWRENQLSLFKISEEISSKFYLVANSISDIGEKIKRLEKELLVRNKSLLKFEENHKKDIDLIKHYKKELGSNFPDQKFWKQSEKTLHQKLPWNFKTLHDLRAELLIASFDLHKAFIINASQKRIDNKGNMTAGPLMNNLRACRRFIGASMPSEHQEYFRHLWASFFCVVPTVSTTFASFTNLCRNLNAQEIGYLLVDEAGQAIPQAAFGAIYRSKRVIVVGDPMQIKPVITTPKAIVNAVRSYHKMNDQYFDPHEQSVQTIADRNNSFGASLGSNENKKWVGCPLRVHRRCLDPMFTIANKIAYDNFMINATFEKESSLEAFLPQNVWYDIKSNHSEGNWIHEEGQYVRELLGPIFKSGILPPLYIISPFKAVSGNMRKLFLSDIEEFSKIGFSKKDLRAWSNEAIGTIHTFQGKEADTVILLLGGNKKKPGSLNWASCEPNLLNVALTRAKNNIIVVGDYDAWSDKPYFQELTFFVDKLSTQNENLDFVA